jgi:hypothetical protein
LGGENENMKNKLYIKDVFDGIFLVSGLPRTNKIVGDSIIDALISYFGEFLSRIINFAERIYDIADYLKGLWEKY